MNTSTVRRILGMTIVLMGVAGAGKVWAYTNPIEATVTVTPTATVSLSLGGTTTYAFGNVPVAVSTTAGTALTLTNDGQVGATVTKKIITQSFPAGWTANTSSMTANNYILSVGTAAAQPATFAAGTILGAEGNSTALTSENGSAVGVIPVAGTAKLWFKLDMPITVSATTARTISVEFTGTTN